MIAGIWHVWFGWPDGSVLTNLIAWIIGLVTGVLASRRAWKRHKAKIELLHQHVLQLHEHHGIDTIGQPPRPPDVSSAATVGRAVPPGSARARLAKSDTVKPAARKRKP